MNADTNAQPVSAITPQQHQRLAENWQRVIDDVAMACRDARREPDEVTIVGVTKYVDASMTAALHQIGCHHLGENRPQLLWRKAEALSSAGLSPQWHQIGQLQTNKVRRLLRHAPIIHTVDRSKLASCVADESKQAQLKTPCLIEINISGDTNKSGLKIEEAPDFVRQTMLAETDSLTLVGLMGMSGLNSDGMTASGQFASLRELRDQLESEFGIRMPSLSMGMSGDFREAIQEGATVVRIGSSIFAGLIA